MNESKIIKSIIQIGKYCLQNFNTNVLIEIDNYKNRDYSNNGDYLKNKLKNNEKDFNLYFFLHHMFMRGRSDVLSLKYYKYTENVLKELSSKKVLSDCIKEIFKNDKDCENWRNIRKKFDIKNNGNVITNKTFQNEYKKNKLINKLALLDKNYEDKKEKEYLSNGNDLLMVIEVLYQYFIKKEDKIIFFKKNNNIHLSNIKAEFEKIKRIKYIGDKLASFYLRNIIYLMKDENDIKNGIKIDEILDIKSTDENSIIKCLLPIDTWIAQVICKLHLLLNYNEIDPEITKKILANQDPTGKYKNNGLNSKEIIYLKNFCIKCCKYNPVNIIYFNQGCWYLGYNSLDILLTSIENYNDEKLRDFNTKITDLFILKNKN